MKHNYFYILLFILGLCPSLTYGQDDSVGKDEQPKKIIQFSGLVVEGDSLYGIPGVSVFVPSTGRGAITSSVGYFSFPVIIGDSVMIRTMGYREKSFVIPEVKEDRLSVIIELTEDTLILPMVEIFPYPTEKLFKEAFIALKLPETELDNMHKNLNEQVLKRMLYTLDHDGSMNHKYYMKQQVERMENKMMAYPAFNLMNPFAWAKFIRQIKNGEHKNKAKDYQYEDVED